MDIVKIIQETATWIEKVNNDYEVNLYRTPELIPAQHYCDLPDHEKGNMVNNIVAKRSKLLDAENATLIPVSELLDHGRIMLFNPGQAIWDGIAEDASSYYIDYTDSPPFDTWVATIEQLNSIGFYSYGGNLIHRDIIIAWVPRSQYFYADEAIQVSMLNLYQWAENKGISDEFSDLKDIFKEPEKMERSTIKEADLQKRRKRLDDIVTVLDKNSPPYQYTSMQQDKPKSFFQKLFGK